METIPWLIVAGVLALNFFISYLNARTVGLMWAETKMVGGWQRFMAWMGAIMAASGFTWCYLVVLLFGAYYAQNFFLEPGEPKILTDHAINAGFSLGYILLIPGILFCGLMIWIDSLMQAWRKRDLPSLGIAAWNTFAQIHNTYEAFSGIGGAWDSVSELFGGSGGDTDDDGKGSAIVLILALVVLAIWGGVFTTWGIIAHYAGTRELSAE